MSAPPVYLCVLCQRHLVACPYCGALLHYIGERHFANGGRAFEMCPAVPPGARDIHTALPVPAEGAA